MASILRFIGRAAVLISLVLAISAAYCWCRSDLHWNDVPFSFPAGWNTQIELGQELRIYSNDIDSNGGYITYATTLPTGRRAIAGPFNWKPVSWQRIILPGSYSPPRKSFQLFALTCEWWFLFLIFSAPPAFYITAIWRRARSSRKRKNNKLCLKCGYDLRASPDRCPECGTPVNSIPADTA
jgi:hypothetical protein